MPDWNDMLYDLKAMGSQFDIIRRKYIKNLSDLTGRNTIIYYSAFLEKPEIPYFHLMINESDKNGFMTTVHNLVKDKGLDLILHTAGGDPAATESIVYYLKDIFNDDIRVIVPQIALSAGTMIACAAKSILMGKHSSLGPIDPQIGSMPAHGLIEEFKTAVEETQGNPAKLPFWQLIISKYPPTLIGESKKAIDWANEMVREWLSSVMLKDDPEQEKKIKQILSELGDHALTKSHSRHISAKQLVNMGLKIENLDENKELQDAVLSVHHACIHTMTSTGAYKIIENQLGKALIRISRNIIVPVGVPELNIKPKIEKSLTDKPKNPNKKIDFSNDS